MRKLLFAVICLLLCVSCKSPKIIERTSVEVRTVTEWKTDTVTMTIERETEKVVTRDTTSHLINSYAESTASVSDGFLTHSLSTIPQEKEILVQVKYERKDSIIYRNQIKEVKVNELTKFQRFQIKGFRILILITIFTLLFFIKTKMRLPW